MTVDPAAAARTLAAEAGLDPNRLLLGPVQLVVVALGWATVEAARAAEELGLPAGLGTVVPGEADGLLGATTSIWRPAPDEPALVLLEPSTEGLLAAGLARRSEGPVALYVVPVSGTPSPGGLAEAVQALANAGVRCRTGHGPFGPEALVLDRAPAEPQLVLVGVPSAT